MKFNHTDTLKIMWGDEDHWIEYDELKRRRK